MNESIQKVPIDAIDDPVIAMRTNVKDEDIATLKADMQAMGLIQPITLRRTGERYEIIAGHRRTTAARELGWAHIDAKVIDATDEVAFAMRAIENLSRADVNPVDEAVYIGELMTKQNKTPEDIVAIIHRSRAWVDQRLEIFNMPEYMQNFIRQKRISLGAALELNRVTNEERKKSACDFAALNGVSVAQAKRWVIDLNAESGATQMNIQEVASNVGEVPSVVTLVPCARCGGHFPLPDADLVYVHRGPECPPEQ